MLVMLLMICYSSCLLYTSSALIDREESIVNALSGFLTMHDEKVRVIVVAPKNVAGDRILSELFGIGIRNFASGSDFVVIRQKLLKLSLIHI